MGNFCCPHSRKAGAFRQQDLAQPLLVDIASQLRKDAKVVVIRLISCSDLSPGSSYTDSADPYVELRLLPKDDVAGEQKQRSSMKPSTKDAKWEPPERFQLVTQDVDKAKIILSVYSYNQNDPEQGIPLGDKGIKLADLNLTEQPTTHTFPLKNPTTGVNKGKVELSLSMLTVEQASGREEQVVYEYQRWQPVKEWGHTPAPGGHFLITDPGRWSTDDGRKFGDELTDVASPVPEGWIVTAHWNVFGTETDVDGWQYATIFDTPFWYPQQSSGIVSFVVRRRTWHREIRREGSQGAIEASATGGNTQTTTNPVLAVNSGTNHHNGATETSTQPALKRTMSRHGSTASSTSNNSNTNTSSSSTATDGNSKRGSSHQASKPGVVTPPGQRQRIFT